MQKNCIYAAGVALCEEFSRHTFCDEQNQSMIVSVSHDWVDVLINRMKRSGFKVVTKIEMENTTTIVFSLNRIKKSA